MEWKNISNGIYSSSPYISFGIYAGWNPHSSGLSASELMSIYPVDSWGGMLGQAGVDDGVVPYTPHIISPHNPRIKL